ncbi:MAG: helix-turn-helix domain-containing protein [Phycisphaerales bacterium]|nr:helix-turn-helix domain-containing protein [Phycisphaerales bacterium]
MTAAAVTKAPHRIAWSVAEAAVLLGCCKSWIRRLALDGVIAHVRIGSRMLILDGDLVPSPDWSVSHVMQNAWPGRERVRMSEIAAALGVCQRTIKRLANRGEIPGCRIDARNWSIPRAELLRWLLQRRRAPRAELERCEAEAVA